MPFGLFKIPATPPPRSKSPSRSTTPMIGNRLFEPLRSVETRSDSSRAFLKNNQHDDCLEESAAAREANLQGRSSLILAGSPTNEAYDESTSCLDGSTVPTYEGELNFLPRSFFCAQ